MAALSWPPAQALEPGAAAQTIAGVLIGASAGVPPPGIYMFNQVFTFQANLAGPGTAALVAIDTTGVQAAVDVQGFSVRSRLDFPAAEPMMRLWCSRSSIPSVGSPVNAQSARHA